MRWNTPLRYLSYAIYERCPDGNIYVAGIYVWSEKPLQQQVDREERLEGWQESFI